VGRLTFASGRTLDRVVGITGAPGAGKSTLTDRVISVVRQAGQRVGVLAIDPSSPFSGGAILGDRVRMQGHSGDDGVFIRSMATRGHLGGLTLAAPEAVRVLAAVGLPVVLIETVGVGQVEVEVAGAADTTVVVVNPGWGDAIQANKAGLLEIADVFVVNKADRPGAAETRRDLEAMLDLGTTESAWRPPVVAATVATGEGVADLWGVLEDHRRHLDESGELEVRRARRLLEELTQVLVRRLERDVHAVSGGQAWTEVTDRLLTGITDPYSAADELLAALSGPEAPVGPVAG
jgi:LAO/AO transport system kinase